MVDVVCVNWGSKYPIEYTKRLYNMVRRNTSHDFKFYCLTDCVANYSGDIHAVELKSGLTGWWNKMQLFRTDVLKQGEYLYFDLDVVITGNIDCLFDFPGFGIPRDFINPDVGLLGQKEYNSSIMKFAPDVNVWRHFNNNKPRWNEMQKKYNFFGDQNVISDYLNKTGYNSPFPDEWIWSFKIGTLRGRRPVDHSKYFGGEIPPDGKVCVFHGRPNPDEVDVDWVRQHWI